MKLRQLLLFFFIQVMTFGCSNKSTNDIIEVDPMAEIIFDISVAEGFVETFLLKDTALLKDSVYQSEINKVLQLHNITPAIFSKSYTYYTQKPVLFKQVLDSANARALRYKDEAIKIENKPVTK